MRLYSFLLVLLISCGLHAQSSILHNLERNVPSQGKVTIHQDSAITKLIGTHRLKVNKTPRPTTNSQSSKNTSTASSTSGQTDITIPSATTHKSTTPTNHKAIKDDGGVEVTLDMDEQVEEAPRIIKVAGYRIQVYAGNNTRNAKIEALHTASKIRDYFPETTVYTFFSPPRWLCRVGDFRTMEEAYSMMRKLKATGVFREVSIVKDRVNVTL
jgi:hypothetical protein